MSLHQDVLCAVYNLNYIADAVSVCYILSNETTVETNSITEVYM